MKKNHKTVFKWVCGILAVCPVILAACTWYLFGSFITAANSIEKLEDGLYAMEYNGDYGFDEFLDGGGAADDTDVRDMLESVAQKNYPQTEGSYEKTMWSIVYCPLGRYADFYFAENFEHSYGLMLQEKGSGFLKR